jgi:hypothetical protein
MNSFKLYMVEIQSDRMYYVVARDPGAAYEDVIDAMDTSVVPAETRELRTVTLIADTDYGSHHIPELLLPHMGGPTG